MIRVGFVCDSLEIGGQELGFLELIRRLDRARFSPYLYAFRPGFLFAQARSLGIPIMLGQDKPGADREWTQADSDARLRYRETLARQLRADAIDVCLLYAWGDGVAAAQDAGIRAIVERLDGPTLASRIADKSPCRRVICESRGIRDLVLAQRELLRCRPEQLVVIPNGIDLNRFDPGRYDRARCRQALGVAAGDFVIGSVARLAPEKNLGHLLRAAKLLIDSAGAPAQDRRRIQVIVAGPDLGCRAALESEAGELEIADRVRLLGARSDVPEILAALDVFTLTSIYEGSPFALLEAMAMGLPVVATHVGAVSEVIDGNGYLVGPLSPEQTCRALRELLLDGDLRARLGGRSRGVSQRYDIRHMVKSYEAILLEALAESRAESAIAGAA
jgi:glycosyltransferase involved in cell wall biosynthesis